jgi:Zn-finger nucleic acid-binding protein
MNCKFCASPLPIDSLVCGYCKQRNAVNLKALAVDEVSSPLDRDIDCPLCKIPLKHLRITLGVDVFIEHCTICDGFLIDEIDLEKVLLFTTKEVVLYNKKILRFILDNPRKEKEKKPFYRECPHCKIIMKKKMFKKSSGIMIDKCTEHQLWLDSGELIQMLEWKKVGGEERKKGKVTENMTIKERKFYYKLLNK